MEINLISFLYSSTNPNPYPSKPNIPSFSLFKYPPTVRFHSTYSRQASRYQPILVQNIRTSIINTISLAPIASNSSDHLDFSVAINSCHDQILHKMQVLTNMEIQLLRNLDMHFEMIHDVRVMIVNLEEVYKDVKDYFQQMGIQFVYDFFRKIQVLMVCGYNFMSQALLVNVDKVQDKKMKDQAKGAVPDCKVCKCTCDSSKVKKRQIKQVQHFDYKISMLENEEQKLTSEIQSIYDKMMMQKAMIEKTKPSLAIRELEDMKEHIQNVMESTNSIFEQSYMMKYVEFKNYLSQIKKPQDIVDYFVSNMNYNMKDKFLKAMQKAIYKAQHMEEKIEMKHVADGEVQTENVKEQGENRDSTYRGFSSLRPEKNTSLLTKERKYNQKMVAELQYVKRQLNTLVKQAESFRTQLQQKQSERLKSAQNYQTLEQLYNKRATQLDDARSENKWLASEKQTESKKLRHQIKELKKEQVETVGVQTQTYIAPNCTSVSTQTQIIYFQNQVDNQIINVLKKANQKMINSLNEKEKKLRQLQLASDQINNLKHCKISCLAFLHDLRQVTQYKLTQTNKETKTINPDKISTSKQPIIPLNQFTTLNSVNLTIQKLSSDIKKLLLAQPVKPRPNEGRISSVRRQSKTNFNERRSSKASEFSSEKSAVEFFRGTSQRRNSYLSPRNQIQLDFQPSEYQKSFYNQDIAQKNEERRSGSQSSISQKNSEIILNPKKTSSEHCSGSSGSSGQKREEREEREEREKGLKKRRASQVRMRSMLLRKSPVQMVESPIRKLAPQRSGCTVQIETDTLRPRAHKNSLPKRRQTNVQQYIDFVLYGEHCQQTDLTNQMLSEFEENYQAQLGQIQKLKATLAQSVKNIYSSHSNRKNKYMISKPGRGSTQKLYTQQSDRNLISLSHTMPMNEAQISQNIHQQLNRTIDPHNATGTSFGNEILSPAQRSSVSNMTLQSRLSTLINPGSRGSVNGGLVVFKKPKEGYEKRSTQLVFDELKVDTGKDKQKNQARNISFNTQRGEASFNLQSDHKTNWKKMISKIEEECELEKENMPQSSKENNPKFKNQPQMKSNFGQRIAQEEDTLISKRSLSRENTLIDVSKKTPLERQRRVSPRGYEPPENAFNRAIKHMLLTTESKETIVKKLNVVCESLEKEKEEKRVKKVSKQALTVRESGQRRNYSKNSQQQGFKLAQIWG